MVFDKFFMALLLNGEKNMKPLIFLMSLFFNITVFGGNFNPSNFTGDNRPFTYSDSNYFVTLNCSSSPYGYYFTQNGTVWRNHTSIFGNNWKETSAKFSKLAVNYNDKLISVIINGYTYSGTLGTLVEYPQQNIKNYFVSFTTRLDIDGISMSQCNLKLKSK